jgi:transcriptional regulator NrdR family protein
MLCPDCGQVAKVFDTRPVPHNQRRRRYHCTSCPMRFTTHEAISGRIREQQIKARVRMTMETVLEAARVDIFKALEDA